MEYKLTIKQIQEIIEYCTDKKVRADKIKSYLKINKSRMQ